MNEIVAAIQGVNNIVSEISSASQEQSSSVGQVGQAIKSQANQLVQAMVVFKLDGTTSSPSFAFA